MADWTDIANTTLEPDAPLTSATMLALRDNPQAVAEGAAGAPRIVYGALRDIQVGDAVFCRLTVEDAVTGNTSFENKSERSSATMAATILNSGTVRVKFSHRGDGGSSSLARVFLNNSIIQGWTTGDGVTADRQVDVSVELGDKIILQHVITVSPNGSSRVGNAVICADASSPIVAA
jgi:hypothetical protein